MIDMYHDHLAMIDLNPLVVERFMCKPPSYAPTDEYWSMWYTIKGIPASFIFVSPLFIVHSTNILKTKSHTYQANSHKAQSPTMPASTTQPMASRHTYTRR